MDSRIGTWAPKFRNAASARDEAANGGARVVGEPIGLVAVESASQTLEWEILDG